MKVETLESLQSLLNELNSVVNTYTCRGYDNPSLDDAFYEADDALESEIQLEKKLKSVLSDEDFEKELPDFLKRQ